MFLYHHFYENSMSGASSYVQVFDSTDPIDAFDQMSQDIQLHLSCVELADKIYIANAFQAWMDAGFPGECAGYSNGMHYSFTKGLLNEYNVHIHNKNYEDQYYWHITDNITGQSLLS